MFSVWGEEGEPGQGESMELRAVEQLWLDM